MTRRQDTILRVKPTHSYRTAPTEGQGWTPRVQTTRTPLFPAQSKTHPSPFYAAQNRPSLSTARYLPPNLRLLRTKQHPTTSKLRSTTGPCPPRRGCASLYCAPHIELCLPPPVTSPTSPDGSPVTHIYTHVLSFQPARVAVDGNDACVSNYIGLYRAII